MPLVEMGVEAVIPLVCSVGMVEVRYGGKK